jgi:hypothetical protein
MQNSMSTSQLVNAYLQQKERVEPLRVRREEMLALKVMK